MLVHYYALLPQRDTAGLGGLFPLLAETMS